ncbi:MAG TPA: dihydrofolate reductase, partial [Thermoanaerobaculia bacterium]|nr:dihydrofolate reductase [Thermoanaerobaculia bacterium]
ALAAAAEEDEAFVAGGGEIYQALLPRADRLYLTEVAGTFDGDAFFPPWERSEWRESSREEGSEEAAGGPTCRFVVYERTAARAD